MTQNPQRRAGLHSPGALWSSCHRSVTALSCSTALSWLLGRSFCRARVTEAVSDCIGCCHPWRAGRAGDGCTLQQLNKHVLSQQQHKQCQKFVFQREMDVFPSCPHTPLMEPVPSQEVKAQAFPTASFLRILCSSVDTQGLAAPGGLQGRH